MFLLPFFIASNKIIKKCYILQNSPFSLKSDFLNIHMAVLLLIQKIIQR